MFRAIAATYCCLVSLALLRTSLARNCPLVTSLQQSISMTLATSKRNLATALFVGRFLAATKSAMNAQ